MAPSLRRRQYGIMLDVAPVQLEAARTDPATAAINARILGYRERAVRARLEAIATHLRGRVGDALVRECRA